MTTRRRLLVYSAPVVAVVILVVVKCLSVVIAGNMAASHFASHDTGALHRDVATLSMLNVAEPAKAPFAAGTLAVLQNRLDDAEREFSAALAADGESCSARVNLVLVRETMGDRAMAALDGRGALDHYLSARELVAQAPRGCFAGNRDADEPRRVVREQGAERLDGKIAAARAAVPPPPPVSVVPPPGVPPPASGPAPESPDATLRLDPGAGDPFDRLQQILRDAQR
ncbi:hypothetical protein [Mycolicibacterium brisbanense]|uniref:Uncharacterized protein n=1 Tax=Mycolicibacterium brisbanense TaxID=146020 RepID=A0A100W0I3_9MYCO|nr:hypothetical protein [Mycolicibacterium brisbanense]MCV7161883.1 hypothetical protein [Mycolicibacterium brisbanense]GAS89397.1 uncharacterized protein RMCB_3493 [Mycolicibacterium brisbanense]